MIDNFAQVERATESAYNAEGSAMAEYSIHMDTLQASLNTLQSAWSDFAVTFMDTDFLKGSIDTLTTLLEILEDLVDKVDVLPLLVGGGSLFKNANPFKIFSKDNLNLLANSLANTVDEASEMATATSNISKNCDVVNSASTTASQSVTTLGTQMKNTTQSTNALNLAFKSLGKGLLISAVVTGVTWGINKLIDSQKKAREELEDYKVELRDLAKQKNETFIDTEDEINNLDILISKYKELKNSEDSIENRNEILDIQRQITDMVGNESDNLDLVNGKLNEQLKILNNIQKSNYSDLQFNAMQSYLATKYSNQVDSSTKFSIGDILGKFNWSELNLGNVVGNFLDGDFSKIGNELSKIQTTDYEAVSNKLKILLEKIKSNNPDATNTDAYNSIYEAYSYYTNLLKEEEQQANNVLESVIKNAVNNREELSKFTVDSAEDYNTYRDRLIDILDSDSDVKQLVNDEKFSTDEVIAFADTYMSTLDGVGNYTDNWVAKYRENKIIVDISIDTEKTNLENLDTAISESFSDAGLSTASMDSIKALYSDLENFDASKLFEKTSNGIRLNKDELEQLQKQYEDNKLGDAYYNLTKLAQQYDELTDEINNCSDAEKRKVLIEEQSSLQTQIDDASTLISQYEALTSAHSKWQKALSSPNEGDNYDSYRDNLDNLKKLYENGDIGTDDFKTAVQIMTDENLTDKTANEIAEVYKDKLPMVKKFFTEGTKGCNNFLKSVNELNKEWAYQDKNGNWHLDFDTDELAKELGVSKQLIEYMIGELRDKGFNIEIGTNIEDLVTDAEGANKRLKQLLDGFNYDFNFDTSSISAINSEIDKATDLFKQFKKDGVWNLDVEGTEEAQQIMTALLKKKQQISNEDLTLMDVEIDETFITTEGEKVLYQLKNLKKKIDKYDFNIHYGVDEEALNDSQADLQSVISKLGKLKNELKKSKIDVFGELNLDENKFTKAVSSIEKSVSLGAEIKQEDIDIISEYISNLTPEMLVKAGIDESLVNEFIAKDKDTTAIVNYDADTTKVEKARKKDYHIETWADYKLLLSDELTKFMDSNPLVKGTVEFGASGLNKIKTSITNLFNNSKDDKKGDKKKKKHKVDGTASYASGTAFSNGKSGNWSIGSSGTALVGELGQELVCRSGRFFTIGDNGAEFFDYQPNDIIFNAKQTEQLLKYGKIVNGASRGRALASGTAFANGSISGLAFSESSVKGTGSPLNSSTKNKKKSSSSKSSSKSKSNNKSSSDKANETKETFDWIEIAIERIENAINDLDKIAGSVYYSFSTRNKKLKSEYSKVGEEIKLQQKAYTRYMKEANSVGLSSKYKKLVQKGAIDIDTIKDENLKEKINDYQTWYEKAIQTKDTIDDLKLTQRELRQELSDNIASQYDGLVARIEHSQTLLENYASRMELRGMSVSTKYYDALISTEQQALSKLKTERTELLKNLNTALTKGDLAKGSEAWNEMQGKIDEVTESIQMCTNNIFEFQNEIRQIEWDNFDYLHDTISQITSETEFLISLLESQDMFSDNGTITNAGMSTMGLHGSNHNMFMEQSQSYAREIEELNRQIANAPNNKDLIERRNELLGLQRDMILSAEAEKQAMIDLAREGYDLQLESLQELIDKYSETLDSQKELYDYQKKLKDQTKEVADLEKQLSAYQGDNSEETQAKIQQIKLDLEEARDNLEETEYDKYISDQKELLETMYTDYEEIINARFDNTDALFSDLIADVNANATTINSTLTSETDKVGYALTDSLTSIWGDTGTVLSDFSNGFADFSGKFDTYTQNATTNIESLLGTINSNLVSMLNASDKLGTSEVTKALDDKTYVANATMVTSSSSSSSSKTTTTSSSSKSSSSSSSSSKKSSTAGYISSLSSTINSGSSKSYIKRVQTALKALGFKGKNGKALSVDGIWGTNTDYAVKSFQKSSKYGGKITADGIIGKNTKAKFKKAGYKKGIYNLKQNELAWTQEDNIAEAIIRPSDGAILTPLVKGDSVLNGTATSNLWDMTNDPSKFIRENLSGDLDINSGNGSVLNNSVQNNIDMNITLPNVKNYTEFVNELQRDSKFERMIQDMTINQLSGKSSLNKFRHKFK